MCARVSQAISLSAASFPAAAATGAFLAPFGGDPLSDGAMIGAELGRLTNRISESRVSKYGPLMVFPEIV